MNENDRTESHQKFILWMGGEYFSPKEIKAKQRQRAQENKEKHMKIPQKKGDTVKKTLALVKEEKILEEMSEIRGLTRNTLISHIRKIDKLYPEVNLSYLQPDDALLDNIQTIVDSLLDDEKNFTE